MTTIGLLASACSSPAPADDHEHGLAPAVEANLATCGTPLDVTPDAVRVRKDRLAKGLFYASRQLQTEGEFEQWTTPYGLFWVVERNFRTFTEVLAEQGLDIYGEGYRGVRPGDVVLDGGAHFGGFVRKALDRGAKLVVAIEIAPENAQCLRRNYASEIAAGRVIVYEKGVWHEDGTMVLERARNTWADHVAPAGPGPTVAVTTIDKIVAELKLEKVNFIKLDIEGAERNALAGATEVMKNHRPRMAVAAYHERDDLEVLPRIALTAQPAYEACVSGRALGHGYATLLLK